MKNENRLEIRTSKLDFDRTALHGAFKQKIPGYLHWRWTSEEVDKGGADMLAIRAGRSPLFVDLKVRTEDPIVTRGYDDLLLETWSCRETGRIGWAKDESKNTDLVAWIFPTGRVEIVSHRKLRQSLATHERQWKTRYPIHVQATPNGYGGYTSECLVVPRFVLFRALAAA